MIFYYLWREGLLARTDGEKLRFFLGLTTNALFLSRRRPLIRSISWPAALISPTYARAVAGWLRYRADLYDGAAG
ncbi:MAG TPA: hypothetical protein VEC57_00675 [Candidatus Limnocylindrales bacterium]|nr:hypothetical protein [Candidatus Limnocylindrales bacterium]